MSQQNSDAPDMSDDDGKPRARATVSSDDEGAAVEKDDLQEDMDDLFGDGGEDDANEPQRTLDDSELDSGDDEGRDDRAQADDDERVQVVEEEESYTMMDVDWPRVGVPMPSDGELYLMKVPRFMAFDPVAFNPKTFTPPTAEHHSKDAPEANFSAIKTAMTTLRWRRSPSKPSELQSNARINRWSDGSLTLQLASDPLTQYEIQPNALAPPQRNPLKPTPLSQTDVRGRSAQYDVKQDTFTYLGQPSQAISMIPLVNKFTTALAVIPAGNTTDDAMEKLRRSMAAAQKNNLMKTGNFIPEEIMEDPELQKKRAEQAEKEKMRAQRKLEQATQREAVKQGRAYNRLGGGGGGFGRSTGLTIGGLEDDGPPSGRRGAGGASRAPKPRRKQREDWSEDEADGQDYEEDDFVAPDEEDEEEEDAEGEDEEPDFDAILERQFRDEKRASKTGADAVRAARDGTPKRSRPAADEDDDDAPGGGQDSPVNRTKRRRVVDEDDDDE